MTMMDRKYKNFVRYTDRVNESACIIQTEPPPHAEVIQPDPRWRWTHLLTVQRVVQCKPCLLSRVQQHHRDRQGNHPQTDRTLRHGIRRPRGANDDHHDDQVYGHEDGSLQPHHVALQNRPRRIAMMRRFEYFA
jgi:hypothetical protein